MTNLLPSSRLALPGYCVRNMGLPNGLSAVGKTALGEGKFLLLCLTMYNLQSYQYDQVVHKLFSKRWNKFTSTEQETMSTWLLRASSVHSGSILSSCPYNPFPKLHVSNRAYFRSLIIQESY